MKTLVSALRGGGDTGTPLPTVIRQLHDLQADIRYGELSMLVSAPGVGKSVLAMIIARHIKLPTLYISADTSAHTMGVRMASNITGETVTAVDKMMRVEPGFYSQHIHREAGHIVWDFTTSPDIQDIQREVDSFAVVHGDYPHLLVVDNIRNVFSEEDDTANQQHTCENLKTIAADTGSAVLALHHVVGRCEDGTVTPTLADLENKTGKPAALVVTLSNGKQGDLRAAVVKNRYGPASGAGRLKTFIPCNLGIMRIGGK